MESERRLKQVTTQTVAHREVWLHSAPSLAFSQKSFGEVKRGKLLLYNFMSTCSKNANGEFCVLVSIFYIMFTYHWQHPLTKVLYVGGSHCGLCTYMAVKNMTMNMKAMAVSDHCTWQLQNSLPLWYTTVTLNIMFMVSTSIFPFPRQAQAV